MQKEHIIQLRHVPDRTYRELRSRAGREGLSLQVYVLRELERIVARPTLDEMLERIADRGPLADRADAVGLLAAERDERDRELTRKTRRER